MKAIGRISDIEKLCGQYSDAFAAIGNNKLCAELLHKLKDCVYTIRVLVPPSVYVSRTATFGIGAVVEPKAVFNANSNIGEGVALFRLAPLLIMMLRPVSVVILMPERYITRVEKFLRKTSLAE